MEGTRAIRTCIWASGSATWQSSRGTPSTQIAARLRSPRARLAGASCSPLCNRSPITWHHCQRAASAKRTASLSNQFRDILADAGLVEPRTHQATGKGRSRAREASEISFHSLRHSAVTMLKAAGVSDFIAREIVGHESAAVSRQYTHLTTEDKRAAVQRLPDVTNG